MGLELSILGGTKEAMVWRDWALSNAPLTKRAAVFFLYWGTCYHDNEYKDIDVDDAYSLILYFLHAGEICSPQESVSAAIQQNTESPKHELDPEVEGDGATNVESPRQQEEAHQISQRPKRMVCVLYQNGQLSLYHQFKVFKSSMLKLYY